MWNLEIPYLRKKVVLMPKQQFSTKKRIKSFKFAFHGISSLFRNEHNSWIHAFFAFAVIVAGFLFAINTFEWIAVIFAIGFVFTAELINSSIEKTVDLVTKETNPLAKQAKDLAAGAVLVAAITAAIIGVLIFAPKIFSLL